MLSNTVDWVGYALIAIPIVVVIGAIYLLGEIRNNEPDVYEAQGRPHLWFTNLSGLGFLFGFVLLGEYRSEVQDQSVKNICLFVQIMTWVWLALVFGFLVMAAGMVL